MQNKEKDKSKSPYRKLQAIRKAEAENWENCHEIEVENNKPTLLLQEIKDSLKTHCRGSRRHNFTTTRTRLLRLIKILLIVAILIYIASNLRCFAKNWDKKPEEIKWEEFCQQIPVQEQGENCSILRAKVIKSDNK